MTVLHAVVLFLLGSVARSGSAPANSVSMKVVNNAGAPIELFWVNIFKTPNELVLQTSKPIRNSSDTNINSYDTHEFQIKFLRPTKWPDAKVNFVKGPREEVVTVSFDPEKGVMEAKQVTKFDEIMDTIRGASETCGTLRGDPFSKCVADAVIGDVQRITDSKTALTKHRDMISNRLRNYTCADPNLESSLPVHSYNITVGSKQVQIDSLMDTPHAKIWVVENFITEEECDILVKHGGSRLRRATVAAEDGSSIVSENRKAQQASYNLNHETPSKDPLWPLYQRVMSVTNHHAGMHLEPEGQEDFTIIQYNVDDQYTPHCDGTCDGSTHISGGRVATAVLYCRAAERGGGTTFTKSDIFVKPRSGMGTFFSYKGPDGRMDEGYTEHSGCPVLEGEKWITTVWMREGVSLQEPWTMFDPNGVKMMDESYTQSQHVEPYDQTQTQTQGQGEEL